MNRKILGLMIFVIFVFGLSFSIVSAEASETITVKANVLESVVSISVPDQILFPDVAPGYLSERADIEVINTGTIDVSISTELPINYSGIFENLVFQNTLSDPMVNINFFDFDLLKPSIAGGTRADDVYMYLDLQEYEGAESGYLTTEVTFVAVPM